MTRSLCGVRLSRTSGSERLMAHVSTPRCLTSGIVRFRVEPGNQNRLATNPIGGCEPELEASSKPYGQRGGNAKDRAPTRTLVPSSLSQDSHLRQSLPKIANPSVSHLRPVQFERL